MEGFDAPGLLAPAELAVRFVQASAAQRPQLNAGGQPLPIVILLDLDVRAPGG